MNIFRGCDRVVWDALPHSLAIASPNTYACTRSKQHKKSENTFPLCLKREKINLPLCAVYIYIYIYMIYVKLSYVLHATSCVHSLLASVLRDPCPVLGVVGRPGIRTCLRGISALYPSPIILQKVVRKKLFLPGTPHCKSDNNQHVLAIRADCTRSSARTDEKRDFACVQREFL